MQIDQAVYRATTIENQTARRPASHLEMTEQNTDGDDGGGGGKRLKREYLAYSGMRRPRVGGDFQVLELPTPDHHVCAADAAAVDPSSVGSDADAEDSSGAMAATAVTGGTNVSLQQQEQESTITAPPDGVLRATEES
jgi:hypothetical protein